MATLKSRIEFKIRRGADSPLLSSDILYPREPGQLSFGPTPGHRTASGVRTIDRHSEYWSIEAHHHVRDVTFREDTTPNRTGSGSATWVTIRAANHLRIPDGQRDHITPAETLRLHGLDQDRYKHSRNAPEPWLKSTANANHGSHLASHGDCR